MSVDSRSRVENILNVILDQIDPSVLEPAQSRVEALLLLLEGKIEDLADLAGKLPIHICIEGEYNPLTGMPTISNPKVDIFYLVPSGSGTNVYDEWVYSGTGWEQFGGGGTGILPNFSIGTVTTLPEGSQATVTLTGTMQDPVLNFGIPEGQAGDEYTVLVQAQQPVQTSNKLWINPGNSDIVEIPTYEEFEEVAQDVDEIKSQVEDGVINDVQINGTSIVQNGVANVPIAGDNSAGVIKSTNGSNGIFVNQSNGYIGISKATNVEAKAGTNNYKPIVPSGQHESTFYGLAKAAGDATQSASSNAVGAYTDEAKVAIQKMLGVNRAFELINEINVDADIPVASPLTINTDSNSESFALDAVNVFIIVPATSSTTMNGHIGVMKNGVASSIGLRFANFGHASYAMNNMISLSLAKYGLMVAELKSQIPNANSVYTGLVKWTPDTITADYIDSINIRDNIIPAGTVIQIWGHRI